MSRPISLYLDLDALAQMAGLRAGGVIRDASNSLQYRTLRGVAEDLLWYTGDLGPWSPDEAAALALAHEAILTEFAASEGAVWGTK